MRITSEIHYFDSMSAVKKYHSKLLEPVCRQWELTHNELNILLFLLNNSELDRAADIVSYRGIAKSHVSLSVANLEKKELLTRHFDEDDRRAAHLKLTDRGIAIAEQANVLQTQLVAELFRGISPEQLEIWRNMALIVQKNIQNLDTTP